jgi:hypothetical protein
MLFIRIIPEGEPSVSAHEHPHKLETSNRKPVTLFYLRTISYTKCPFSYTRAVANFANPLSAKVFNIGTGVEA